MTMLEMLEIMRCQNEKKLKKYNVSIQTPEMQYWEWNDEAILDYVEAESEDEAIDLAKDYLRECCIDNRCDPDIVDTWAFRAIEKV